MTPGTLWSVRRIVVLGSTGSIGTQTLDVCRAFPGEFRVVGLAAHSNRALLTEQAREFGVAETSLFTAEGSTGEGVAGLDRLAELPDYDTLVVSVAGVIGLSPTLAAIAGGKRVALASKEVLVAGGETVMALARENGVEIAAIDSEHSAVAQCLRGEPRERLRRLLLTCSGGPFRGRSRSELGGVTVEEALAHPTWRMGGKITVDSATLMNKALEMVEARWLFDLSPDQIQVVIHPQSVVHSMVEFTDGSVMAQMGRPDMRVPISVALFDPGRAPSYPGTSFCGVGEAEYWNPLTLPPLTFETPDEATFPALGLAREAMRVGGTLPGAMNAADEEAANAFLRGELSFLGITEVVADVMDEHRPEEATLTNVLASDVEARAAARRLIGSHS